MPTLGANNALHTADAVAQHRAPLRPSLQSNLRRISVSPQRMSEDNLLGPRPCHMLAPGSGLTESAAGVCAVRHPQKAAGLHVTAVLFPPQTRLLRS